MLRTGPELATLATLIAAQALLFGRLVGAETDYDEGVYLSSVRALEQGQELGKEVFSPQPPGWYLLLRLLSVAGADTVRGFQIGMVVVSIGICLAAYVLARALAGPLAGLTASALLTIAPPFPLYARRILADLPPFGIALVAFWLAWQAQARRSAALATGAGAALTLAITVKPSAVLALPPFLVLLLWERDRRGQALVAALGGAAATAAAFLLAYRDVLDELWESVVVYHRKARDTPPVIDKTEELLTFLNWRTPFAWLVVAGLAASVLALRRRRIMPVWALWAWAALAIGFLVYYRPLHLNHLLVLTVVLAVPAGVALGDLAGRMPRRELAVGGLALLLAAGYVQQHRRTTLDDIPEEPELVRAAQILRKETKPTDLVVSDQPIVPFMAGRIVAGPLVDIPFLRFQTGSLTDADVLREIEAWNVEAVVVGRALATRPQVVAALERRFPRVLRVGELAIFVRG